MDPEFDAEGIYDEDFLRFYAAPGAPSEHLAEVGDVRSDADTELLWQLLDLEPGMTVLDLACGYGRIANRLAARGARVTGLDSSAPFLAQARADADWLGVEVDYVAGDMRQLPWTGRFDRVVNWFTAFGYFHDTDNRRVLDQIAQALRSGGRLAMDLNNVAGWLPGLEPSRVAIRDDGEMFVDRYRLEPLTGRLLVERVFIRDGPVRRVPYYVRMFLFPELRDWLLAAGFTDVAGYGEDGEALTATHQRMIVVARTE